MKFLITESKLESLIFKYLDNQDFIKIEKKDNIYFVNSVEDKYVQIKFRKKSNSCYIYNNLIEEISSFFSLDNPDSKNLISKWVENTLQMKVSNTWSNILTAPAPLRIPITNTGVFYRKQLVENT